MAINMRNCGFASGRLTRDPMTFVNKDGSKKIKLTIAVQDNFKSKDADGKAAKNSQYVQLDAFVPASRANESTVYDLIHQGDMIGVQYSVQTNNYEAEDGSIVYSQILKVETIDLKETKATTAARQAGKATA